MEPGSANVLLCFFQVPMEGGKSGQRRTFFLLKEQDLCWEEVLRGGPSLSILGLYIYFDEHLICCNLSVLLQGWHVQLHRLHTAQHQELCGINLGDPSWRSVYSSGHRQGLSWQAVGNLVSVTLLRSSVILLELISSSIKRGW